MGVDLRVHIFVLALFVSFPVWGQTPQDCQDDHFCYKRVAGAVCADGTPTGYQVMYRKGAKNLMILMGGGGACWDYNTCTGGNAMYLSEHEVYEGNYFDQSAGMQKGWRDLKDPNNPISTNFNYVFIPYCTADVFTGDRVSDYGTTAKPYVIHHKGYNNTILMLDELKKRFPQSEKVLFYGTSAGGLGVSFHAANLADRFPDSQINVINDGGLPFKSPMVDRLKVKAVFEAWGAEKHTPGTAAPNETYATHIVKHLQKNYPKVKYGFVSAYKDYIMSYFSRLLLAGNWTTAVRDIMISLADDEFAASPNFHVFYLNDWGHVYYGKSPSAATSEGVTLFEWANAMLGTPQTAAWSDVRPDLSRDLVSIGY